MFNMQPAVMPSLQPESFAPQHEPSAEDHTVSPRFPTLLQNSTEAYMQRKEDPRKTVQFKATQGDRSESMENAGMNSPPQGNPVDSKPVPGAFEPSCRSFVRSPVRCSGWLLTDDAHGLRQRSKGIVRGKMLGADYQLQWFAVVAFDKRSPGAEAHELQLIVVTTADADTFGKFQMQLKRSEEVANAYQLCSPSPLKSKLILGKLFLRSVIAVNESTSLSLPNSLYAAIDIRTQRESYTLGVMCDEDLETWMSFLLRGMFSMRKEFVSQKAQKTMGLEEALLKDGKETDANKWVEEVGVPRTFHTVWLLYVIFVPLWVGALLFFLNPYLAPCDIDIIRLESETQQCVNRRTAMVEAECQSWEKQKETLGPWRSWVEHLQLIRFFENRFIIDGNDQTCFSKASSFSLFWFWGFVIVQIVEGFFSISWTSLNWRNVVRGARLLDDMKPKFHPRHWPDVDVLLCHYSEPAEDTIETLKKMLAMEYPADKLHIYICDDGYLRSDYSKVGQGVHWPSFTRNEGNIKKAGDVRQLVKDFMLESVSSCEFDGDRGSPRPFVSTRELIPDVASEYRVVDRIDCAVGFIEDIYKVPGMPRVSFVARVKPRTHHAKAGNVNNVLFNVGAEGRYCVIFDNDMAPHPKFLIATLPLFFESTTPAVPDKPMRVGTGHTTRSEFAAPKYTDDLEFNQVAYVQTPQYFKKNDLMLEQEDPLSHNNGVFFDAGMQGMDGYDSVMFVGTNCLWRREALDSIGGIQYGTISEDFWTGHHAHWLGWDSAYLRKDLQGDAEHRFRLSEGNVPDNVAASLAQRKRWHKGGVELFLGVKNEKDKDWTFPEANVPQRKVSSRVMRFRRYHWFLARISWINVFPALFYTFLTLSGLFTNKLWLYLNTVPSFVFMVPFLILNNFNLSLGNATVSAENWVGSTPEYFTYACVKTIGTLEAFYSKITGSPAAWGNTGGIRKGSIDEIPNVVIVVLLVIGLVRSLLAYMFFSPDDELSNTLPIWGFSLIQLSMYWKMARVSIQEFFAWSYRTMDGTKLIRCLVAPVIMAVAITLQMRAAGEFN